MLFELVVVLTVGFNTKAVTIFLGPALLIVLAYCLHFFVRQTKIAIVNHKGMGKAVMAASLLFAYGAVAARGQLDPFLLFLLCALIITLIELSCVC